MYYVVRSTKSRYIYVCELRPDRLVSITHTAQEK